MDPIQVRIRNFQSIQEAAFTIHGMTCIVGKTNIGKSATLRSIASAILNQPVTNMIRHGEKICTVELHTKNWGFKWEKGTGTNRYKIDGKDEILDSVGRGQIDEIRNFGFGTIKIGEDKYLSPWYANQYGSVFLLNESGPAITDFISGVSRLDVLQDGIVFLNKEKKRYKEKIKIIAADVESLNEKKKNLDQLPKMREVKADLKLQYESIQKYETKIQDCKKTLSQIESLSNTIMVLESIQQIHIPNLLDKKLVDKIHHMRGIQSQLDNGAQSIIKIRFIEKIKIPDLPELPDLRKLAEARRLLVQKNRLEKFIESVPQKLSVPALPIAEFPVNLKKAQGLLKQMTALQSEIEAMESKSQVLTTKIESVTLEMDKIPKCPTCHRPWSKQSEHKHTPAPRGENRIIT